MLAYRRDIDGLRALAVLAVVCYHALPAALPGGFVGVDVFFVISGYLITSLLLRDLQHGDFSLGQFYIRRIRRIYPALIVVIASCLVAGWFLLLPEEYAQLGWHSMGASLFIPNFLLWKESGYFDSAAELKPLLHLRSLGVEEQFYLLWPLLVWAAWRWHRHVAGLMMLLGAASLVASILCSARYPEASFFLPHTRFWELMAGGLLARNQHRLNLSAALRDAMGWAGLLAILLAYLLIQRTDSYPGWLALLPVGGAVALIAAGPGAWTNRRLLSARPMVAIGLISYPLYLWHWPLLSFLQIMESGTEPAWLRLLAVGLSVLLATLTYALVEKPIRLQRRIAWLWLLCTLLLLGSAGVWIDALHGLREARGQRSPMFADLERLDLFRASLPRCAYPNTQSLDWCFTAHPGPASVALFGDSHADALLPGFYQKDRLNWLLIGQSACPPLSGVELLHDGRSMRCKTRNRQAIQALASDPAIRVVVLANVGSFYIGHSKAAQHTGEHAPTRYQLDDGSGDSKEIVYQRGLEATIDQLERAGKQVVMVMDVPQFGFQPIRCVNRPFTIFAPRAMQPCATPQAPLLQNGQPYRALLARVQKNHPALRLYDPYHALCDGDACFMGRGDTLYYRDTHHLSQRGAAQVAMDFIKWRAAPGR